MNFLFENSHQGFVGKPVVKAVRKNKCSNSQILRSGENATKFSRCLKITFQFSVEMELERFETVKTNHKRYNDSIALATVVLSFSNFTRASRKANRHKKH